MPDNAAPDPSFEMQVVDLMEQLLGELNITDELADIVLSHSNGIAVTVAPRNLEAAPISLHFYSDGGFVDFSFGSSLGMFELDGSDYMERLRVLSRAVMQGRCGETWGLISQTSWLEPVDENRRFRSSSLFHPRLWRTKRQFEPY